MLARRTPLAPKVGTSGRRKLSKTNLPKKQVWKSPRCELRGCTKTQDEKWAEPLPGRGLRTSEAHGMCRSHARREALARWSASIRKGYCELSTWHRLLGVRCGGSIVGCHGFGKGAYPGVMFEAWNGFSGCSGINQWTEDHPLEWDDFLRAAWGAEYDPRHRQALAVRKYDLAEVLTRFAAFGRARRQK